MLPLLEKYLELQKIDQQLAVLAEKSREIPQQLELWENKVTELENSLKRVRELVKKKEKQYREIEQELADLEEKRKKEQGRIYTCKNQKDLDAVNSELAVLDRNQEKFENEGVVLLDDAAEFKKNIVLAEADLQAAAKDRDKLNDELNRQLEEVHRQQQELQVKRDAAAAQLPAPKLKLYENISEHRDGIVIAQLELPTESCGACHVHLRPQIIENVYTAEEPVRCEGCQRFLYLARNEETDEKSASDT